MTFNELSHDELVKRCEGMWELNSKLWEVTKDLYENCVEGTADPEWWRGKLLDLGIIEEEEEEEEERNTEAAWNYAVKWADTYQKAHPEDTETVREFLGAAVERLV